MRYTKNFTVAEMASKDGKDTEARMCPAFMKKIQALREDFRHPMRITSAIRSLEHNEAVGGSPKSQHLTRPCIAADVSTAGWDSAKLHRFVDLVFQHGFTGIGIADDFIHIDTRKTANRMGPRLWTY